MSEKRAEPDVTINSTIRPAYNSQLDFVSVIHNVSKRYGFNSIVESYNMDPLHNKRYLKRFCLIIIISMEIKLTSRQGT